MAIVINGSGTVTGISVGGLPDGIVDNGTMADDAIAIADLAATGTASSTTFLRGDNSWQTAGSTSATDLTSGTLPTARLPVGSVLQVASTSVTATATTTSTSFVTLSTLNQAITPITTSSKVLVSCSMQLENTTSNGGYVQIIRTVGGTDTAIDVVTRNSISASRTFLSQGYGGYNGQTTSLQFLDSPSTTSAITYSIKWSTTGGTATFNSGTGGDQPSSSSITLMEIAG